MTDFDEFLEGQLNDPEFRAEYGALEPEFAIVQAVITAQSDDIAAADDLEAIRAAR